MNNQKLNIYIYLAIFSALLTFTSTHIYDLDYNKNMVIIKEDISSSAIWYLSDPIVIDDSNPSRNWSKTAMENAWCSGTGTWNDPYIISDVEIDMEGEVEDAILISNSEIYFKIKNCDLLNIYTFGAGIYLDNITNGVIFDNKIYNSGYGIEVFGGDNIVITDNIIYNITRTGMRIYNCNNSLFQSNNITDFLDDGIHIESCYYCSFNLNTISSIESREYGISMESSDHNEIKQNTINDLNSDYADGIYLSTVINNTITENEVSGCRGGIILHLGENNNVSKNYCHDNDMEGLIVLWSSYNEFIENLIVNNTIGISINSADFNYFFKNEINNGYQGISAFRSDNNALKNNTLSSNHDKGIYLLQCFGFNLTGNLMFDNGLYLEDSDWSDEELISHNIDSTNQVNNRNLYYYTKMSGLKESDFTNAGQVILYNCTDSIVNNLNLSRATCGLLSWLGENNTFSGNDLSYNSESGMKIFTAERLNISNNIANYCSISEDEFTTGLLLVNINHAIITGNTANHNKVGIYFYGKNSDISYNTANFNEENGMKISGFNHTISYNTANRNEIGISLSTSNSTFTNNYASYNLYGLELDGANYNLITSNEFIGNRIGCIDQFPNCQGNIFRDNICLGEWELFWTRYLIWIIVGIVSVVSLSVLIVILRKMVKRRKKYSE